MGDYNTKFNNEECTVWYLGHSGWAVKTKKHLLIFDYVHQNAEVQDSIIHSSQIIPTELKSENVYVFVSHGHDDHYDETIFSWSDRIKNIKYILGHDIIKKDYISVTGKQNLKVDDLDITTIYATDDGVGFLVKVDGLSIVHLGDHAKWVPELEEDFNRQIDYLADIDNNINLLFIPVARGIGIRTESITEGVYYTIGKLNPKIVFPMHGGGKEHLYREFAQECGDKIPAIKISFAEKPGDNWRLDHATLFK